MAPGPDDKNALIAGIFIFHGGVDTHRAIKVFGIKPSRHIQDRMFDIIQVLEDILFFPVFVVIAVFHVFIPGGNAILEIFLVHIGNWTQFQEEFVAIRRSVSETGGTLSGWACSDSGTTRQPSECVHQAKGSVVVKIIADPHIRR